LGFLDFLLEGAVLPTLGSEFWFALSLLARLLAGFFGSAAVASLSSFSAPASAWFSTDFLLVLGALFVFCSSVFSHLH
jgi:hypothetical protein